jgi:hypothetical protein
VCRIVGWVVVAIGAVLTVVLAVVGATGGSAFGAVFGLGVGAVPGGAAGALAGASTGLKILGVGFALVSVGDFLDVAADWGEGKIDGQDLVKQGSLEAVFALTSLVGFGAIGKIAQKLLQHVPESWLKRLDDLLQRPTGHRVPASDKEMLQPLHSGSPLGPGWKRQPDIEPDDLYGQSRPDFGALNTKNQVPSTIDPDIRRLGGDLSNPWGIDPDTGLAFTEAEWLRRFTTGSGDVRWPPNRGAVPGTRVEFYDADRFLQTYGDQFDRVGNDRGSFLGVPPGATFGERSLPPSTLKDPLSHYTFDTLPPGMTIEVSEIAPAFGRPGGALQVRFMDNGKPVSVAELIKRGVLT